MRSTTTATVSPQPRTMASSQPTNSKPTARHGQLMLLLRKNAAVFRRNWCSTLIMLFISLPPVILLLGFSFDDELNTEGYNKFTFERRQHHVNVVGRLASCSDFTGMSKCKTDLAVVFQSASTASTTAVNSAGRCCPLPAS